MKRCFFGFVLSIGVVYRTCISVWRCIPFPHIHTLLAASNPQFRKSVRKVSVCVSGPVRPALWSLSIGGPAEGSYGVKALLWNIATWLSGAAQRGTRIVYCTLNGWLHVVYSVFACCLSRWCVCAVSLFPSL
jgi:hypothetical protein